MRARHLAPLLGLSFAACQSEAPLPPVAPTPIATVASSPLVSQPPVATASASSAPAPAPLVVHIASLAVPLSGTRDIVDAAPIDTLRRALAPSLRDCVNGASTDGKIWLVARVATSGAVQATQVASSDLPDASTKCIVTAFEKVAIAAPSTPLAISFVATFETPAAPKPTSGNAPNKSPDPGKAADPSEDQNVFGGLVGGEVGEAFGAGGLGLRGIGEGGGGRGEGIGLGSIGSIGHGSGTGTGQGFGNGNGRLGGSHSKKPPQVRMGATSVSGRLPPEVIQRIVRQNFGRFRLCYENGLRANPSLEGRVSIGFTIETDGSVSSTRNAGSDLPSDTVVSCVRKAFDNLSFPQPEGGKVKVVYPIMFSPGDDAPATKPHAKPAAPKPKPIRVGGKSLDALAAADVVRVLDGHEHAVTVTLDDKPGSSYVVFTEYTGEVFAIERPSPPKKGEATPETELAVFERVDGPSIHHSIRVVGASTQLAGELMELLVE